MNVYTFILCALLISVSDYKIVSARTTYDNPSYSNDRDENLSIMATHQKKRLANEDALREEDQAEEYERNAPLYDTQRFRKYEPNSFSRHDRLEKNRELAEFEENKMNNMNMNNMNKRDYYDSAGNLKDASIEVILDPRAKKAVAVVENSPSGQAMYDLTGWKNKDDNPTYDSDQYSPGAQEQVVNLVYPAERNERKYSPSAFDSSSDYSEKAKSGFKDKLMETDRTVEDTHKRKRNAEMKKQEKDFEKRSTQDKSKRKTEQTKIENSKQAGNECPPHNTPSSMESDADKNNNNENKFEKQTKREAPQWSQEQLDALKNSLSHVRESSGEVQNLRNILTNMGLIDNAQITNKRETAKLDSSLQTEKRGDDKDKITTDLKTDADNEDEDLNQDNIVLKRNDREVIEEEEDVNKAPQEPVEKREVETENNSEEEENEEVYDTENEKKEAKRSNNENEPVVETTKEEINAKDVSISRKKRQDVDNNQKEADKAENPEKSKENPASDSEMNKNNVDMSKKYTKRDINSKNHQNVESDSEYEKRMENQIQQKIDAIKEKVKREILEEQLKRRYKRNSNAESEAFKANIRKRRQSKKQNKEEASKENSANEEKSVAISPGESQSKMVRRKRANTVPEKQMVYRAYQTDQDEEAEDDSEFDDNSYDGRLYVEKRQTDDDNDYFDPVRKREIENYMRQYYPEPRARRSFNEETEAGEDSNAFHGSRKALKNRSFAGKENQEDSAKSNDNDSEYFGSLPQTYNGELTRYKRVKRDNPYK